MKSSENYLSFHDSNKELRLNSNVIEKFREYQQIGNKKESGGVLLGKIYNDYDEILEITTPNRFDNRGLFFFIRSRKPAQVEINRKWKQSEGKLIYLGEWHTHSEINPIPSSTDKEMIQQMLNTTKMEIDYLYLIIVGLENTFYVGRKSYSSLNPLNIL